MPQKGDGSTRGTAQNDDNPSEWAQISLRKNEQPKRKATKD